METLDPKLVEWLRSKYMRNLAEEFQRVDPISVKSISDPATGENIFTWTHAKHVLRITLG